MICFSQEKVFYPWQEIFGTAFVKKYETEKIGRAAEGVYFDGRYYYRKNAAAHWESLTKEDFATQLRAFHEIDPTRHKGETASECDQVIAHVQRHQRVDGVAPRIYWNDDIFIENGKRYLNISRVKPLAPVETPQRWGERFPWLAGFLGTCWDEPMQVQRDYFFAWFKRFYVGALRGNPPKGQALFVAGLPDRGKTLLATIIAKAMGGSADAKDILLANTKFNKEAMEVGLWVVDDGSAAQDERRHKCFSELVKAVVANSSFNYEPKFKDAATTSWTGRLLVCLNDAEAGIGMIPALEPSIEDKLMILRFSDAERHFPERAELQEIIDEELPYFLRWLTDWEMPNEIQGRSRFGCKNYIHPVLRLKAMNSNGLSDLVDVLKLWIKRCAPASTCGNEWVGTAAELLTALNAEEGLRALVKFSPAGLGKRLSQIAEVYPAFISIATTSLHKGDGKQYRIHLVAADADRETVQMPESSLSVKVEFDGTSSEAETA